MWETKCRLWRNKGLGVIFIIKANPYKLLYDAAAKTAAFMWWLN